MCSQRVMLTQQVMMVLMYKPDLKQTLAPLVMQHVCKLVLQKFSYHTLAQRMVGWMFMSATLALMLHFGWDN